MVMNATFGGTGVKAGGAVGMAVPCRRGQKSRAAYEPGKDFLLDVHVFVSGDL